MIGLGTVYLLGAGGMQPASARPWDTDRGRHCDCSGFAAWACGYSRQTSDPFYVGRNGGWINTDAMRADGYSTGGVFSAVAVAEPGDLIVFPGGVPGHNIGHVGVVAAVDASGKPARVVHCSSGNYRNTGDAIRETGPEVFDTPKTVVIRYDPAGTLSPPAPSFVQPQGKLLEGKMSTFGGPDDTGVAPSEGLALLFPGDLTDPHLGPLFLGEQPPHTSGLARRLNPKQFYIACRWNYIETPKAFLRHELVRVENPRTHAFAFADPVDWGPNDDTDRVADLSPGLAELLGLQTDDVCRVLIPLPPTPKGDPL